MENMPDLVIENIAKFLSAKDIGACCSTSTSWRVAFNQDHVWRPFCDQLMAAHLKVTHCQVEPCFVSPESEDHSLSPICEWRLSYMREVHLWNNWRQGRYKKEFFGSILEDFWNWPFIQFINRNQLLIKLENDKRVMLWDVKESPTYLYDPVTLKFDVDICFCEIIENTIIFVQQDTIQKYKINQSTTADWELQGIYKLSSPTCDIFITADFLVVSTQKHTLEIFYLKSCEIVNISIIPRALTDSLVYNVVKGGISSMYFIMLSVQQEWDYSVGEPADKYNKIVYVYSIEKLDFIDFNITIPMDLSDPRNQDCTFSIHEEFLTVFNNRSIKVFRYLTSELVLDAPCASSIGRHLLSNAPFPFLSVYRRDCTYMFDSRDLPVFFINSYLCSGMSPIVRNCLGLKSYDIARLLRHVTKYLAFPTDLAGVGIFKTYPNRFVNNTYTKCIDRCDPYIMTFW